MERNSLFCCPFFLENPAKINCISKKIYLPMICESFTSLGVVKEVGSDKSAFETTWFALFFLQNKNSEEKINVAAMSPMPSAMKDGKAWSVVRGLFGRSSSGIQKISKCPGKAVEVVISLSILMNIPLFTIREIATLKSF